MNKRELYNHHKKETGIKNGHICVCMGISKEEINNAISQGANSYESIKEKTRAGVGCSLCEPIIGDILAE